MRRIKPFVSPVTLQTIYKTLVQPYFDYCSPLWDNIAAKYSKINCKNFKIAQLGLSLEPATMLDLLMCSTPLGGRQSVQDDREINRY